MRNIVRLFSFLFKFTSSKCARGGDACVFVNVEHG